MKRGVTELNYLGSDIDSNPPKKAKRGTHEGAREEMRLEDAYALPRLASVSDVHSGGLTHGWHTRDRLRTLRRRCPGLNDLSQTYRADLEASLAVRPRLP